MLPFMWLGMDWYTTMQFEYLYIILIQVAGIVHPAVQECKLQQNGSYYFYNGTIIYVRILMFTYAFVL